MLDNIENLKIISVFHKKINPHGKIESRNYHTFIIRVSGCVQYTFDDKTMLSLPGEMIYLPKGSKYDYKKLSEELPVATIINLDGDFGQAQACRYSIKDFHDADNIIYHLADMWKFGSQSQKYKCLSLLYDLLAYISNLDSLEYGDKKKFHVIEPAVSYLQRHIYNCDLKIDTLHRLCGISNTYFRKLFIARFGTSPKNYVINKRTSYAKSIIDSGELVTVKELALTVGYKDPLYFGKVFKRHYGTSPIDMNR